jgi:hypothetical protein
VATDQQPQVPSDPLRDVLFVFALLFCCGPFGVIAVLLTDWPWRTKAIAIAVWALLWGGAYGGYRVSTMSG